MATKHQIAEEINKIRLSAQDSVRHKYLKELSDCTGRDTLVYCTAFSTPKANGIPGNFLSLTSEDMQGLMTAMHGLNNDKLDIIIHSPGGSVETVDQIVSYLRAKYTHIRAIIPQNAMSAACMWACACDEIIMGKHSAIGPIDPQITFPTQNGSPFTAPAHSLISEFNQAKGEIMSNPASAPLWIPRLTSWPPGLLDICDKHIKLAKQKVSTWLEQYMFNGEADAHQVATDIAEWLGNDANHLTHGHPVAYAEAKSHKLKVSLLEDDQDLQEKVLSVYHASIVTIETTNCVKIIENQNGVGVYTQVNR